MRNICLGIDTTGNWCSVALVDDAGVLAATCEEMSRGHAERLGPMAEALLAKAEIRVRDITKISVCAGPGSFTGLRVGMSFAKGLALPHDIPVVGISTLEVWAFAHDPMQEGLAQKSSVLAVADVRRGQVFWQVFKNGKPLTPTTLTDVETAQKQLTPQMGCVGNGAHLLGAFNEQSNYVCPKRLAWIGIDRSVKTHPATPLYHRPPDAKLPGGKSL
ncbi:MAG: tRNA (adenosine(37)-N6)-threonylcarbamoyltransferase complex dimerization subunit type 1 TsaB [Robiginitomaculum sp.]|nr:MAG: tRNA (adenosine(37)-N6)-threonylcarbamoyltransferase complex dimerization subunit type 1 TsaB [Robiginitomaculum sp.]